MSPSSAPPLSPFTDAPATERWGKKDGRTIYVCPDTRAVFFDRRDLLKQDAGEDISPDNYDGYYPYLADFDAERAEWEIGVRRPKYRAQLTLMRKRLGLAPTKPDSRLRLLDVGAGPGYLVAVAEEEGWAAQGVEISPDAVTFGREHYGVEYTTLEEVPPESLDAVTCHHVLEHVEAPTQFLRDLASKLRPGGLLVLHVPHQRPLTFALRDTLARLGSGDSADTFCCLYDDIHIQGFTSSSLQQVVEHAGLQTDFVKSAGMWSRYYDPFFWKNYGRDGDWATAAKKAIRHIVELAGVPFGMGDWVIGYFHKPRV